MTEWEIIEELYRTRRLLPPLLLESPGAPLGDGEQADAFFTTFLEAENPTDFFYFLVEIKSRSTPQAIYQAISQIREATLEWRARKSDDRVHPMIVVPYLSEDRIAELYEAQISGVDLCGNGVVTVPGENLLIYRTGKENLYPESRPVSNPFQGKSSLVARVFFKEPVILANDEKGKNKEFSALNDLRREIEEGGVDISLSQVSKAVSALKEKRLIGAQGRSIYILDPDEIMRLLAVHWAPPTEKPTYLRIPHGLSSLNALNEVRDLDWAISGASSVRHYAAFAEAGRVRVIVSDKKRALEIIPGEEESVPNFADIEVIKSDDPGYYFDNENDEDGIRWASRLQTWIELSNGDARQQDAARHVYHQIMP